MKTLLYSELSDEQRDDASRASEHLLREERVQDCRFVVDDAGQVVAFEPLKIIAGEVCWTDAICIRRGIPWEEPKVKSQRPEGRDQIRDAIANATLGNVTDGMTVTVSGKSAFVAACGMPAAAPSDTKFNLQIGPVVTPPTGDTVWLPVPGLYPSGWQQGREKDDHLVAVFKTSGFDASISRLSVQLMPDGRHRIIIGERRWKSAVEAGLERVACVVIDGTEAELLFLQLLENMGRADLTPMQEADAIARLLQQRDAAGTPIFTEQALATKLGKTPSYVQRRARIAALGPDEPARLAANAGKLGFTHLWMIAVLPGAETRAAVTMRALAGMDGNGVPMTAPQLRYYIHDHVMLELRGARFELADETLLPAEIGIRGQESGVRTHGGSCLTCPAMSHNFVKAAGEDEFGCGKIRLCLHPACFRAKEAAEHRAWLEKQGLRAAQLNGGATVDLLSEEENRPLFDDSGKNLLPSRVMVPLEGAPDPVDLREDVENGKTWEEIVRGKAVPITVARVPATGKAMLLIPKDKAVAAAQENGHGGIFKKAVVRDLAPTPDDGPVPDVGADGSAAPGRTVALGADTEKKAQESRAAAIVEEEDRVLAAQIGAITHASLHVKTLDESMLGFIAESMVALVCDAGSMPAVLKAVGIGKVPLEKTAAQVLREHLEASPYEKLPGLLLTMAILSTPEVLNRNDVGEHERKAFAGMFGVHLPTVAKEAKAALKLERERASGEAEIAAGMVWSDERSKAEEFNWDLGGLAQNPSTCRLAMPEKVKGEVSLLVARSEKGWHIGLHVAASHAAKDQEVMAPSMQETSYDSRKLAVRSALLQARDMVKIVALARQKWAPLMGDRIEAYLGLVEAEPKKGKKVNRA